MPPDHSSAQQTHGVSREAIEAVRTWDGLVEPPGREAGGEQPKNAGVDREAERSASGDVGQEPGGRRVQFSPKEKAKQTTGPPRDGAISGVMTMTLNQRQRKIVIASAAVFIAMCLCPPWTYTFDIASVHRERPAGYALILEPPMPEFNAPSFGVRLDVSRLLIQLVALIVAAGTGLLVEKGSVT